MEIAVEDALEDRVPRPEDTARNLRVARGLRVIHPGFAAEDEESGAEDGSLELTDAATGLQIGLYAGEAGLSIPYRHEVGKAGAVLALARSCLATMVREGGYFVYDPQIGGIIDPDGDEDAKAMRAAYEAGMRHNRPPAGGRHEEPRRRLFPERMGRLSYLTHWIGTLLVAGAVMYLLIRVTKGTPLESLAVFALPAWFVLKLLVLDSARLRDMGRDPRGTFLSLLGPVAAYMQLRLFFGESVAHSQSPRPSIVTGNSGDGDETPAVGQLYPYLVPAEYLQQGEAGPESLAWPVGHGLHLELAFDLGGLMRNAKTADLARLGLTGEIARQRAMDNLDRLLASGRVRVMQRATPEGDPYVVLDSHWAAATALVWPALAGRGEILPGDGPLLAGVPHRDALCLFRGGDAGRIGRMRGLIREQQLRSRKPLTDALFELTAGGVREIDG